jgi:hypothetical protein
VAVLTAVGAELSFGPVPLIDSLLSGLVKGREAWLFAGDIDFTGDVKFEL